MPREVRDQAARILGSPVVRATIAYGGVGPSATYRLELRGGRRAFFKGVHAGCNPFMLGALAREERVYRELGTRIRPWAPRFYGSVRHADWHALLLEDVGPRTAPPWNVTRVAEAARGYAAFHEHNAGARLPRWLASSEPFQWRRFDAQWRIGIDAGAIEALAGLAGRRRDEVIEWLDVAHPILRGRGERIAIARARSTLLHLDTRSDNLRLQGSRLRLFDWNWSAPGAPEFDVAAFAQSINSEGGPRPEVFVAAYLRHRALDERLLGDCVAAIAGYFVNQSWRPRNPQLPRLRWLQRRQMRASLAWAARIADLPAPAWVATIH